MESRSDIETRRLDWDKRSLLATKRSEVRKDAESGLLAEKTECYRMMYYHATCINDILRNLSVDANRTWKSKQEGAPTDALSGFADRHRDILQRGLVEHVEPILEGNRRHNLSVGARAHRYIVEYWYQNIVRVWGKLTKAICGELVGQREENGFPQDILEQICTTSEQIISLNRDLKEQLREDLASGKDFAATFTRH